jgi:hypothetical protein
MNLFNRLINATRSPFNRLSDAFTQPSGVSSGAVESMTAKNPADVLGDPLRGLTFERVKHGYRNSINQGDTAIATWALHEALVAEDIVGVYARLWADMLSGMDWSIKVQPEHDKDPRAEAQAKALTAAYEANQVSSIIAHLAMAELYGYSVLVRRGNQLEPLDWWNVCRKGWRGPFVWNPDARQVQLKKYSDIPPGMMELEPENIVAREVEGSVLIEYLLIYLSASNNSLWWDRYNERRSWNQVVVRTGSVPKNDEGRFLATAMAIADGKPGVIAKGPPDNPTEIWTPPSTRDPDNFQARVAFLDAQACKALFGAPLIANTAPGSGTLAGNAHADTAKRKVQGAALSISGVLQRQFDIPALREAGLLSDGESPLAYFELTDRQTVDPQKEVDWTATLKQAGFERDPAELEERTGMTLTRAEPTPQPGQMDIRLGKSGGPGDDSGGAYVNRRSETSLRLWAILTEQLPSDVLNRYSDNTLARQFVNRHASLFANRDASGLAGNLRDMIGLKRLEKWDAGARAFIEKLIADLEAGELDDAALDRLEDAVSNMPDDLFDAEALAKFLEQAMAGAVVRAAEDAAKKGGE